MMNRTRVPKKDHQRAVIYTNVSAMERLQSDEAFEQLHRYQTALCRAKAASMALDVVGEYHDEHDGTQNELAELVRLVERLSSERDIDIVLVADPDVFGRSVLQQDEIVEVVNGCGASVVSAGEGSSDPSKKDPARVSSAAHSGV